MINSPLQDDFVFSIGPVPISIQVVTTWVIMVLLVSASFGLTRKLKLRAGPVQTVLETLVSSIETQIRDTLGRDPLPLRALIGTLFIYILCANWASLIPYVDSPTAHIETDAALAFIVFLAPPYFGVKLGGLGGYLKTFAEPSWFMIPLNIVEQVARNFALAIRLFGNIMSGALIASVILMLAGLLVPIPLMVLSVLIGAVQAYIFAILATVFIGSAFGENSQNTLQTQHPKET